MYLGELIKKYRTEHKMSMDDFAKRANLSKAYISMLEKNEDPRTKKKITPSIPTIEKVAKVLGLSFEELFSLMENDSEVILNFDDSLQTTPNLSEIIRYSSMVDKNRQLSILNFAKKQFEDQQRIAEKRLYTNQLIDQAVELYGIEAVEDIQKIIESQLDLENKDETAT